MLVAGFILCILLGIILKKNKVVTLAICVLMICIASFQYNTADVDNYRAGYQLLSDGINTLQYERYLGFYIIQKIGTSLHLTFEQFCFLFYGICIILLLLFISKITNNVNLVLAFFLIYPFSLEAVQMKTFLSDAISLLALYILIDNKTKKVDCSENNFFKRHIKFWKFIAIIILASTVHFSAVFFGFVGLFYYWISENNLFRLSVASALLGILLAYSNLLSKFIQLISSISHISNLSTVGYWLQPRNRLGFIIPLIAVAGLLLLNAFLKYNFFNNGGIEYHVSCFIDTLPFVLIFMVYSISYYRLFRVYIVIILCLFANSSSFGRIRNMNEFKTEGILLANVAYLFFTDIFTAYDTTLYPLLTQNTLLH